MVVHPSRMHKALGSIPSKKLEKQPRCREFKPNGHRLLIVLCHRVSAQQIFAGCLINFIVTSNHSITQICIAW